MRSLLLLGLLGLPAHAGEIPGAGAWDRYLEGLLIESSDGDPNRAIEIYSALTRSLEGSGQPDLRAEAFLALGRAYASLGQFAEARRAFDQCRRISTSGLPVDTRECVEGARRVAVEEGAIDTVPVTWTFEESTRGFVLFSERGSMAIESTDGQAVLEWTQELVGSEVPELVVGFGPLDAPLEGLRLTVSALGEQGALLELKVEDTLGRSYRPADFLVVGPEPRTVEINLADLAPLDPSWPALDRSRIATVHLRDRTGSLSNARIRHRIRLGSFAVY